MQEGEEEEERGDGIVSFVNENHDHTRMMKRKKRKDVEKAQEPAAKKRKGELLHGNLAP